MRFETCRPNTVPDVIAPDGSEVRVLCGLSRGALAVFTLPPGAVSKAIRHRSVEEVWYVLSGAGRIWRRLGLQQETTELAAGICITIPTATEFQFRCDSVDALAVLGATMPPWPGDSEAEFVAGPWAPGVSSPPPTPSRKGEGG